MKNIDKYVNTLNIKATQYKSCNFPSVTILPIGLTIDEFDHVSAMPDDGLVIWLSVVLLWKSFALFPRRERSGTWTRAPVLSLMKPIVLLQRHGGILTRSINKFRPV